MVNQFTPQHNEPAFYTRIHFDARGGLYRYEGWTLINVDKSKRKRK